MGKGQKPIDYNGQRTADAIVDFVLNEARKVLQIVQVFILLNLILS